MSRTKHSRPEKYKIRCKDCGYTTGRFNGWAFVDGKCSKPGKPSMLHNWERIHAV